MKVLRIIGLILFAVGMMGTVPEREHLTYNLIEKGSILPFGNILSCLQMDIMLLGDYSASIGSHTETVTTAFNEFSKQFDLSDQSVKIGVVAFANEATLISPLTGDDEQLSSSLVEWGHKGGSGGTEMMPALMMAIKEFGERGRANYGKILVIICDGNPNFPYQVDEMLTLIKTTMNVKVFGVLVKPTTTFASSYDADYMKQISSPNCYVETDYENLILELKKLDICL